MAQTYKDPTFDEVARLKPSGSAKRESEQAAGIE